MKFLRIFCFFTACVFAVSAKEDPTAAYEDLRHLASQESPDSSKITGNDNMVKELLEMLVEAARATSYSNLLTLNVTNVIILVFVAIAFFSYLGFIDLGFGRSLGVPSEVDVSTVSKAVSSLTPLVHKALHAYQDLQTP
ncbi:uncharacterized protein LOC121876797 [Homarus americanus]|uniref:uncharacterized protein LOC121876797 n=1 Tax=Homarus americanus TaxID=6706 RepID=UPI001C46F088|nr:uncharacterized protein LOC121876797 [Homarus americanus]